jgi:hypothetical protein
MYSLREWQQLKKDPKNLIVQASAIDGSDSWQPFPIGMGFHYIDNYEKDTIQIGEHTNLVLSCFNENTDSRRRSVITRKEISKTLSKNSIQNKLIDPSLYFESLPNYKFVISPEGNGIDCHRHYEALLAGCIPIIEYNSQIEQKYKGCPILYTKDFSEITFDYLELKYKEMINEQYDFSRLFLSSYVIKFQERIKKQGNYWCNRMTDKIFY